MGVTVSVPGSGTAALIRSASPGVIYGATYNRENFLGKGVKQLQASAKKLLRPALAVLVMGTLAACGTGPSANPSGPTSDGPPSIELEASPQTVAQLPITTVPPASANGGPDSGPTIGPGAQLRVDPRPESAVTKTKVEPEGSATPSLTKNAPSKSAPDLDLSDRKEVRVEPDKFRQLLPRDAIMPIYYPSFVTVEDAGLEPGELVIGVEINGESKAYPIGPLVQREMVNDTVGGVPILVTW